MGKNNKKSVSLGITLFVVLGLAFLYGYHSIIASTDWFQHIEPDVENIIGRLANANFMASIATTVVILAFAKPKKVSEESSAEDEDSPRSRRSLRRGSSHFEAFTGNAQTLILNLNIRIYAGIILEGVPMLVFAIIYPTVVSLVCV